MINWKRAGYAAGAVGAAVAGAAINHRLQENGINIPIALGYLLPAHFSGKLLESYALDRAQKEGIQLSKLQKLYWYAGGALLGTEMLAVGGSLSDFLDKIGLDRINEYLRSIDPAFGKTDFPGKGDYVSPAAASAVAAGLKALRLETQ